MHEKYGDQISVQNNQNQQNLNLFNNKTRIYENKGNEAPKIPKKAIDKTYKSICKIYYNNEQGTGFFMLIENNLKCVKTSFNNNSFNIFVYKKNDVVSKFISDYGSWEGDHTKNLLNCLEYYSIKNKLKKSEIIILDIGANVGWYSFYLGNAGYEIIAFEVSKINIIFNVLRLLERH